MNTIKLLSMAAAATMALASCSDFLEAENKSQGQSADDYFAGNAAPLLITAYGDLKPLATQITLNEDGTDLYMNPRSADGVFCTYNITPAEKEAESYYKDCYNLINDANGVVYYSGGGNLAEQARFLRDYGYYCLTQQFGAVPYITNYIMDATQGYPRTDLATVYQNVLDDLTDLYNNSSLEAQSHQGRASKQAVAALAAKVALAKAWDCGTTLVSAETGEYTVADQQAFRDAAAWADKAIAGISLTMTFEDKWSPKNEGNAEEIFSVQYGRDGYKGDISKGGHDLMYHYTGYYDKALNTGMKPSSAGDHVSSIKALGLFEKGDTRYDATFMLTMYKGKGTKGALDWPATGYLGYYNYTDAEKTTAPIGVKNFAWYTTVQEATDWLNQHAEQLKDVAGYQKPFANNCFAILGCKDVTLFTLNADGTVKKTDTYDGYSNMMAKYYGTAFGGTSVKKWDDPAGDINAGSTCYRSLPLLHVSDLYLVKAEALLAAGDEGGALAAINTVRQRAQAPAINAIADYKPEYARTDTGYEPLRLIDLLLDERARELYAERTRWVDLRRTKQLVAYNAKYNRNFNGDVASLSIADIKWLRPIPEGEINSNTAISQDDQNPGY